MPRPLRVLHLNDNIASQMSVTVRALRAIGVDARGLAINPNPGQDCRGLETYRIAAPRRQPRSSAAQTLRWWSSLWPALRWADAVHWHFGSVNARGALDVRLIAALGKPRIVEFWGSDIRIHALAAQDNPYWGPIAADPRYAKLGTISRSYGAQALFVRAGFDCIIGSEELVPYLRAEEFTAVHFVRPRVFLADFEPRYPDPQRKRPIVVHSPSVKALKGTAAVLAAIERLGSQYDFEFVLNHGRSRDETLETVATADIFLDQFAAGDYGLASTEAMAFGKPVVCYIKPSLVEVRGPESPLINATQDNLCQVLAELLTDGERRAATGHKSRAYVEERHNALRLAGELAEIYRELADRKRSASTRLKSRREPRR